jgi:ubiquinone/menaquinone biosynthesis C-methylase UbiE
VSAALERIELPARARVLDVATGAGHTALHLASLGHEVTASDLAGPMLERVREAASARGLQVETRQHAAEELPYPDATFDLVTSRVAPHHFSSPESFIRETARGLRAGGWFLLIGGRVPDDAPEAEAWLHEVEKLRDPSHHRLLSPKAWRALCEAHRLAVQSAELQAFKQPDLQWYFDTAATPPENQRLVRELVEHAPLAAREQYRIATEEGKIVWWWPRLTLIARKA